MMAAESNNLAALRALLQDGRAAKAPHQIDTKGRSAIFYAAGSGHDEAVRILLDHAKAHSGDEGAKRLACATMAEKDGRTVLMFAAQVTLMPKLATLAPARTRRASHMPSTERAHRRRRVRRPAGSTVTTRLFRYFSSMTQIQRSATTKRSLRQL